MYLLEREKRVLSVDGVEENGGQFGKYDEIDSSIYGYCLPDDCQKALDSVFDKMSRLEIYLLMKDCGFLGDDIMEMEMCEFVTTPEFQAFFMEDSSIRSRKDPVKTAYNKKQKLQKMLVTLDGKIIVGDLKGCLEWYLWGKINQS
ncbi:MAG: hypothetical protein K6F30_06385 [Lachnospiraceae bacterium]|nr:hypothetical protein [Lachnospiraceae bacterium]